MSDRLPDPGYYRAIIMRGYLSTVDDKDEELVLCFDVELQGERVADRDTEFTCAHRCGGKYPDIAPQVAQYVGLDWPDGLEKIAETAGREVQVKIKHATSKDGKVYANVYIAPPRKGRKEVDPATAKRLISRLADDASEVPF